MKVSYLVAAPGIPAQGPSGASAHVRGITKGLADLGHEVELICVLNQDRRGSLESPEVPWKAVGLPSWPGVLRRWGFMREVLAANRVANSVNKTDLIIERHALFSKAGLKASKRLNVPMILEVNAPHVLERNRFEDRLYSGAEKWERDVLLSAPIIVAVSQWLCNWLEKQGCKNVYHLPNGVVGFKGDRELTRQKLGLKNSFVIGFVGSFKPWHGLKMLPNLLDKLPEATLILVGDNTDIKHPRAISTGKLSQKQVANYVAAMDVGLAPYLEDAPPWFCPLKILEYRAQGTPVVASDIGDSRLLVGSSGIVVPPGDVKAMAVACVELYNTRMKPFVRSWAEVAQELINLVE